MIEGRSQHCFLQFSEKKSPNTTLSRLFLRSIAVGNEIFPICNNIFRLINADTAKIAANTWSHATNVFPITRLPRNICVLWLTEQLRWLHLIVIYNCIRQRQQSGKYPSRSTLLFTDRHIGRIASISFPSLIYIFTLLMWRIDIANNFFRKIKHALKNQLYKLMLSFTYLRKFCIIYIFKIFLLQFIMKFYNYYK